MRLLLLKFTGSLLASLPEPLLRSIVWILGGLLYFVPSSRRRIIRSNLHHAFPDKGRDERRKLGLESCRRMIETGVFAIILPFLDEKRLRPSLDIPEESRVHLAKLYNQTAPTIVLIPHIGSPEAVTLIPLVYGEKLPELGAVYRPFDNSVFEKWVRETRERFGVELLSRKEGFSRGMEILRGNGVLGILFDQNAGRRGALITFLGRIASATDLPDMLARRFNARLIGVYPKRTGFLRSQLVIDTITPRSDSAGAITLAANEWLENLLAGEDDVCSSWLWLHERWRTQNRAHKRFRLSQKRNLLDLERGLRGWKELPRNTRFWVRMPNWLGDVVMALPLLRALRVSRPDARITVIGKGAFLPLLRRFGVADETLSLPEREAPSFRFFHRLRHKYPDTYILLTNSFRGDLEAMLTRCPQRFGMIRSGRPRPFLTDAWRLPPEIDENRMHQTCVWERLFRHFGLDSDLDFSPPEYRTGDESPSNRMKFIVGLICGTENTPEKRWPIAGWRALIRRLLELPGAPEIRLFGTAADREITAEIEEIFPHEPVIDLAGKTTLDDFAVELRRCRVVVCNDTGGMHLANALGVPVVALFGPTNPRRTGPVFNAPKTILQPPRCPPEGGGSMDSIEVEAVLEAAKRHL